MLPISFCKKCKISNRETLSTVLPILPILFFFHSPASSEANIKEKVIDLRATIDRDIYGAIRINHEARPPSVSIKNKKAKNNSDIGADDQNSIDPAFYNNTEVEQWSILLLDNCTANGAIIITSAARNAVEVAIERPAFQLAVSRMLLGELSV